MWLALGNLYTQVTSAPAAETIWLSDYLAFDDKDAFFKGRAGEKMRLYDPVSGTFPSGLVGMVMRDARAAGIQVNIVDRRTNPVTPLTGQARDDALEWLRDYQREPVDIITDKSRGILWLPTGAGKTEIIVGLTRAHPGKWIAIVHNKKLMHDIARRYELRESQHVLGMMPSGDNDADKQLVEAAWYRLGSPAPEAGRVGDGKWEERDFTVCTFQTLAKALRKKRGRIQNQAAYNKAKALLNGAAGVIVDECHTLPAQSFWGVLMAAEHAYYRVGVSGTPLARGDKRSVFAVAALGPVQYRIRPEVLVDEGVLAKARIRMVPCEQELADPSCYRCKGTGDSGMGPSSCSVCKGKGTRPPRWQVVEKALIVKSRVRNELFVRHIADHAAKPNLSFVNSIEHGKILHQMFELHGLRAAFVWGKHGTDQRDEALRKLVAGEIDVLVASKVFQEGIDAPTIASIGIASGGKSAIAALQKIGRGMRVADGKTEFEVFDIYDEGHRWLRRHRNERIKAFTSEGYEVIEEPA